MRYNGGMAKSTKKNNTYTPPVKIQFHRWLLAALLTVFIYLMSVLVFALLIEYEGGITPEGGFLTTILFSLALASALWWLIESARWIMIHISQRSAREVAAKKATKKPATKKK